MEKIIDEFNNGSLKLPECEKSFADIPWFKHPTFEGVELKHIVTSSDTNGRFSYHLVHIYPNKSIMAHVHQTQLETHEVISGTAQCINNGTKLIYKPGVISIMEAGTPHEVNADNNDVYLFAKFFPALC